jgi:hypothetical protein
MSKQFRGLFFKICYYIDMKIMFLDESGDHCLERIDGSYPMFSLAGCIFDMDYYNQEVEQMLNNLKMKHFKRNDIILRSYDIRKQKNDFSCLVDCKKREEFMNDLSDLIESLNFTIISAVINKLELKNKYKNLHNPYNLCFKFLLERSVMYLGRSDEKMIIRVESREKHNDEKLSKVYNDFRNNKNPFFSNREVKSKILDLSFNPKSQNVIGLQIADLVAHPIAMKILYSNRKNKPFDILRKKIHSKNNKIINCGLKIFPNDDNKKMDPGKP